MGTSIRGEASRRAATGLSIALLSVIAVFLVAAVSAQASFHLIKVREVHPGQSDDSYVELQMFAAGQALLSGHSLTVYDSSGSLIHTSTFSSSIANSANQQTVLVGDSAVQSTFGVTPDLLDAGLTVPAAGGAACWNAGGIPADCVAWGNFSGAAALQAATGTTVGTPVSPGGITTGKAIRRKISPGCATLLEEADDTNVSATDFEEVAPSPRNDSSPITESVCAGAPNTVIDDRPPPSSNSTSAEFTYEAPTATSYECRLDAEAFASCPAAGTPQTYTNLADGSHTFQVRGVNASGPDPTPASYTWTVDTVAPTASITSHPLDPSPGKTAAFRYSSNESGSKFECRLVPLEASFSVCSTQPKTYSNLADGAYEFEVRAIDAAGNAQSTATVFDWTVDNSLADTTPPDTSIATKPSDPSSSSIATFTYTSTEPASTFQCKLDAGAFVACPGTGISYSGLGEGQHTFQVRAIDSSENVDASPAGYTFNVVLSSSSGTGPAGPPPASPAVLPPPPPAATPVAVKRHHRHRHHRRRHHHHRRRGSKH